MAGSFKTGAIAPVLWYESRDAYLHLGESDGRAADFNGPRTANTELTMSAPTFRLTVDSCSRALAGPVQKVA